MKHPVRWQVAPEPRFDDLHRLLGGVDAAFGNVVEKSESDVRHLLADGSACWAYDVAGVLCGVALTVPQEECVLAVDADQHARPLLLREGAALLDEALRAGTPLWLPTHDRDAEAVATRLGLIPEYTDLQMRTHTTTAAPGPAPSGTRLREFDASASALQDVHDLVCAAWGVEDHTSAFLERFGQLAREPSLWVLLESTGGQLLAACFGDIQELGDGRYGVVRHLDVAPAARRSGLGSWALNELLGRFARAGLAEAQLGVHEENVSAAPALYASLGWSVVSSQRKWVRSLPERPGA